MIKQPMLACSTQPKLLALRYPVYASFKMDGIRCVTPNGQVLSRKLKPIPNKYIQKLLRDLPYGLDGELMVEGSFNTLTSSIMSEAGEPNFTFKVFDILGSKKPFKERMTEVVDICNTLALHHIEPVFQHLCYDQASVQAYYDLAISKGYEGLILRNPSGPYKEGRSTLNEQWMLKLKPIEDTEATIVEFTELMHNLNAPETNNVGATERNKCQAGMQESGILGALIAITTEGTVVKVGSGFTNEQRTEIWVNQDKYRGKMFTFKFQERTVDGAYRFPVFKGWRHDV